MKRTQGRCHLMQLGSPFEKERCRGSIAFGLQTRDEIHGVATQKRCRVLNGLSVRFDTNRSSQTWRLAPTYLPVQARAPNARRWERSVTHPKRKKSINKVACLFGGRPIPEGAKVREAVRDHALGQFEVRHTVASGISETQKGVLRVGAELHVVWRLEPFDKCAFQDKRLNFGSSHVPINGCRAAGHRNDLAFSIRREVRGEAGAKRDRFPDVQDLTLSVTKDVAPG